MDNEQAGTPRKPLPDPRTTTGSLTSGSDRQLARHKGLARMSALTMGAGAISALGAVAIAVTLPGSTAVTSASAAPLASSQPARQSRQSLSPSPRTDGDDSGEDGFTSQVQPAAPSQVQAAAPSQVQPAAPPSKTNIPPVATSGAS